MKSKLVSFFRFILIVIILACVAILGKRFYDYRVNAKNNKYIENVVNEAGKEVEEDTKQDAKSKWKAKEEKYMKVLEQLQAENSDVAGFLEVPSIKVAYPVLRGPDNEFYLRKGLNKQYDIAGSIFMDFYNEKDFSDDNTVIYGHHLEIDSMFTNLEKYRDQEFAENNREVFITTNEGLREYKVFSVYGVPADYDYRTLDFINPEEKIAYFNKLKNNSEVELETADFGSQDSIITLSTCEYDYDDQRLAVQAVRVR
jgi:sortase B